MDEPLILVTGSTGKTGTPVVRLLRKRGHRVRALVRKLDERAERLVELGAETVIGDYHDLSSIREAMKGVRRVYFCYPPQGDRLATRSDWPSCCAACWSLDSVRPLSTTESPCSRNCSATA